MARKTAHPVIESPFEAVAIFLRRRMAECTGVVLAVASFYLALALVSYHSGDPSFNRAASGEVRNFGGTLGANVSVFLLQLLGMASGLLALVPFVWGLLLVRRRHLGRTWIRLTLLLVALPALAGMLALGGTPKFWPVNAGLGGYIGSVTLKSLAAMLGVWMAFLILFLVTLVSLVGAFGLLWSEWRSVGRGVAWAGGHAATGAGVAGGLVRRALQDRTPRDEEEYAEEDAVEEDDEEAEEAEARPARPRRAVAIERPEDTPQAVRATPVRGQSRLRLEPPPSGNYRLPPVSLLNANIKQKKSTVSESALAQNARLLESVLNDFGVNGQIVKIRPGPVVTLYELEPSPGTKSSRVIGLADDIARSMSAVSARIAVIPGRNAIGIELPNAVRETVFLRELLETGTFGQGDFRLPLALGKDISGEPIVVDLSRMPHLLVAGTTGSGKSVAINTMILSLVFRLRPDQCKFIMIDPKMLELSAYDGIPHLLSPVVTEPGKAVVALKWTVREMENRYRLMSNLGVRNIDGYNKRIAEAAEKGETLKRTVQTGFDPETGKPVVEDVLYDMTPLPFIVVIVDEMADLMLVAGKDIESQVQRLAQMARAAGIHIIMATQRPSVDVITGVIKANFPTRISFQVTSRIDSRTILGEQGAEQLLGQGDMLYMAGGGRITRVHGPFVSDKEAEQIVAYLRTQGTPDYIEAITADDEEGTDLGLPGEDGDEDDGMYAQAVAIVKRDRKASTSYIQRCLKIGYNRAARIVERMEREGLVSRASATGKRDVLVGEG